jgi:hypothetical protein
LTDILFFKNHHALGGAENSSNGYGIQANIINKKRGGKPLKL